MKKQLSLLILLCLFATVDVLAWGKSGHDAVAYIAECNLTPKAKKHIEKYLDGRSIVYYATWMDAVRATETYGATGKWHMFAVDAQNRYQVNPNGDAVSAVEQAAETLKNYREKDDSTVRVAICMLVHFVGDMHCPSHVRYPVYKHYNFTLNGSKYEFHSFWDTYALELSHHWYYMEYQHQLDRHSKAEKKELSDGTPQEWAHDNAVTCEVANVLSWPDMALNKAETSAFLLKTQVLAESQITKAGYRLARILNELFGK